MIKAVLFDLDGTLLDRNESVRHFVDKQYDRYFNDLKHIPRNHYVTRFIELDNNGYTWKDQVYKQLIKAFSIQNLTYERLLYDYTTHFKKSCIPFPNLISTLNVLQQKGMKLGMITNGKGSFQLNNIRALGIEEYFDVILISEWEGTKKPNPILFKKALNSLDVTASESLFIGDHPEKDVQAAMNVGMLGVWKRNNLWKTADADIIIDHLEEIPPMIEHLNRTMM